ncbi:Outer membrane protein assembly factor BamD [Blochmannia endosymbiont of Polyrhachis (Hedomyrma) turneri]|nr:Outer membrane protein assembly factor BamD [Blochmannia endosymbiont of Polyrhachis (Hedomyrma) turneri]
MCFTPFLCHCKNHTNTTNDDLHKQYLSAKCKLKNKNYKTAIKKLETLNKKYPFNQYSNQIYLDLIYAYYKSMDFSLAHVTINDFLQQNPNHPNLDYPIYISGLINMELDNHTIHKLSFIKQQSKYNPIYARQAFHDFSKLIHQYPNSQYTPDAYKRLIYLKNRIADYELAIIKYYNKKQAYITVINRTEDMLRYFSDTKAAHHALWYMHTAYQKLHLTHQTNQVMKIIIFNKNKIINTLKQT